MSSNLRTPLLNGVNRSPRMQFTLRLTLNMPAVKIVYVGADSWGVFVRSDHDILIRAQYETAQDPTTRLYHIINEETTRRAFYADSAHLARVIADKNGGTKPEIHPCRCRCIMQGHNCVA